MTTTHTMMIKGLKREDEETVSKALHDVWGIRNVSINPVLNEVTISFNEEAGSIHDFQQAIVELGYEVNHPE